MNIEVTLFINIYCPDLNEILKGLGWTQKQITGKSLLLTGRANEHYWLGWEISAGWQGERLGDLGYCWADGFFCTTDNLTGNQANIFFCLSTKHSKNVKLWDSFFGVVL